MIELLGSAGHGPRSPLLHRLLARGKAVPLLAKGGELFAQQIVLRQRSAQFIEPTRRLAPRSEQLICGAPVRHAGYFVAVFFSAASSLRAFAVAARSVSAFAAASASAAFFACSS